VDVLTRAHEAVVVRTGEVSYRRGDALLRRPGTGRGTFPSSRPREQGREQVPERPDRLAAPALRLDVCTTHDRGLLAVAVDPQFAIHGYIYLYYTFSKGGGYATSDTSLCLAGRFSVSARLAPAQPDLFKEK
jgi:hypothetical protein